MGLQGVQPDLGIPLAILLAFIGHAVYSTLNVFSDVQATPPELTAAEVKQGQIRAGAFKRSHLTAEGDRLQQRGFQEEQLDGRGRRLLWVSSWEALRLVFDKTRDVCESFLQRQVLTADLLPNIADAPDCPPTTGTQEQRAPRAVITGRNPNLNLFAMGSDAVPSFQPLPPTFLILEYPMPPTDVASRAQYFSECALVAPFFKQQSQAWFAARAAVCTASNAAAVLVVDEGSCDAHFVMFSVEPVWQAPRESSFQMEWGVRHEMCGLASVMQGLPVIREHLASRHGVSLPQEVTVCEQGMYFVPHEHPLLQGTLFGKKNMSFPLAASPDALLAGPGFNVLIEVKCSCPFKGGFDDGLWRWLPGARTLSADDIRVNEFVQCQIQMLATGVPHFLLVRWSVKECKVLYVPFDGAWCKQMLIVLSQIVLAAVATNGKCPQFSSISGHDEFVRDTRERCSRLLEPCTVPNAKGWDGRRFLQR